MQTHPHRAARTGWLPAVLAAIALVPGATVAASGEAIDSAPTSSGVPGGADAHPLGTGLQDGRLEALSGGPVMLTVSEQLGAVQGNSASQVSTGSNTIADGSFAHSVGLPTVIQNTGANVLIQSSTIVNVQFK